MREFASYPPNEASRNRLIRNYGSAQGGGSGGAGGGSGRATPAFSDDTNVADTRDTTLDDATEGDTDAAPYGEDPEAAGGAVSEGGGEGLGKGKERVAGGRVAVKREEMHSGSPEDEGAWERGRGGIGVVVAGGGQFDGASGEGRPRPVVAAEGWGVSGGETGGVAGDGMGVRARRWRVKQEDLLSVVAGDRVQEWERHVQLLLSDWRRAAQQQAQQQGRRGRALAWGCAAAAGGFAGAADLVGREVLVPGWVVGLAGQEGEAGEGGLG